MTLQGRPSRARNLLLAGLLLFAQLVALVHHHPAADTHEDICLQCQTLGQFASAVPAQGVWGQPAPGKAPLVQTLSLPRPVGGVVLHAPARAPPSFSSC